MKKLALGSRTADWLSVPLCAALTVLGILLFYSVGYRYAAIAGGVCFLILLAVCDLEQLRNLPTVLFAGYAAFSMATLLWAMSGKFFLQQFYKIFLALFFFLLIATHKKLGRRGVRRVLGVCAGICAICAFLSVAGTGEEALRKTLLRLLHAPSDAMVFSGVRLSGVLANANIEATLSTMGVIFSVALLCGSAKLWQRALWAASLALNAMALLLGFSMGAIACFGVSLVIYLLAASGGRGAVLLRLLEGGVPAMALAFPMYRALTGGTGAVLPLLLADVAVTAALELLLAGRAAALLEKRQKLALAALLGAIVLVAAYLALGMRLYGPYTFGGRLQRGARPGAGEHTMTVQADGAVDVRVVSKSMEQIMAQSGGTEIYSGTADGAVFTVPDDSYACDLYFTAEKGVTLSRAAIDGKEIALRYKLFPPFVASRIQTGMSTGSSTILRLILARDGLRLWRLSPVIGNGVGAFETGISRVQDFKFDTRYVHNHYVQILLEDGVIGLALYVAALVSLAAALWKKRRPAREGALRWVHPALCAQLAMSMLQALWDVSLSITLPLCQMYVVYGLIVNLYADPLPRRARAAEPPPEELTAAEDGGAAIVRAPSRAPQRAILMMLPVIFLLSVCGNVYAAALLKQTFHSYEEAYVTMEKAIALDLYEKNDVMLTYVVTSMGDTSMDNHPGQASVYADELSRVQSNSIPAYLVDYYLSVGQYPRAVEEANLSAVYSVSDHEEWNKITRSLKGAFFDTGADSPLLAPGGGALLDGMLEYAARKDAYSAKTVRRLKLDDTAKAFFAKLSELEACRGDAAALRAALGA